MRPALTFGLTLPNRGVMLGLTTPAQLLELADRDPLHDLAGGRVREGEDAVEVGVAAAVVGLGAKGAEVVQPPGPVVLGVGRVRRTEVERHVLRPGGRVGPGLGRNARVDR